MISIFLYLCWAILYFNIGVDYYKQVLISRGAPVMSSKIYILTGIDVIVEGTHTYQFFFFPYMALAYVLSCALLKKLKKYK
jgi:hypothetical protein